MRFLPAAQSRRGGSEGVRGQHGQLPTLHGCCRRPGFAHLREGKEEGVHEYGLQIQVAEGKIQRGNKDL